MFNEWPKDLNQFSLKDYYQRVYGLIDNYIRWMNIRKTVDYEPFDGHQSKTNYKRIHIE